MGRATRKIARASVAGRTAPAFRHMTARVRPTGNQALIRQGAETAESRAASRRLGLQAWAMVGPRNDPFEREADRVAQGIAPREGLTSGEPPLIQRQAEGKAEEEKEEDEADLAQAKAMDGPAATDLQSPNSVPVQNIAAMRGGGRPLPASVRSFFQDRLGHGFASVRLHTSSRAVRAAQSLNAHAFTWGRDIFFNQGRYAPYEERGSLLLAHELTHVRQQARGRVSARNYIQRWKSNGHKELTEKAAKAVIPSKMILPSLLRRLANWSAYMDYRIAELGFNIGSKLAGVRGFRWLFGQTLQDYYARHASRAMNHGEGGLYATSKKVAEGRNQARQDHYEKRARECFRSLMQELRGGRIFSDEAGHDHQRVFVNLGDALHVAQDRGAHGEGARGEGHDQDQYDPDSPKDNRKGYQEAEKNTRDVLVRVKDILKAILGSSFRPRISPLFRRQP